MKAADTASRPPGSWPARGRRRPFRPRRALSSLVLAATAISAGCVWSVPEPVLVREPRPEPIPLRIGVYYSPEFRSFTYRHYLPTDTAYILGKPSVRLVNAALALLFIEVVEVPRPGLGASLRGDLAGVIEPRIVSAAYEYPRAGTRVFPVHITYGFTAYSRRGEAVASWDVTGQGTEPTSNPFDAPSSIRRNFEHAMREAAWKLTSGFRDFPEIRRWLEEQGVR